MCTERERERERVSVCEPIRGPGGQGALNKQGQKADFFFFFSGTCFFEFFACSLQGCRVHYGAQIRCAGSDLTGCAGVVVRQLASIRW